MNRKLALLLLLFQFVCRGAWSADPPTTKTPLADITLDEEKLRVHFIDIGNGLAALIEAPGDDVHVFVDGGDQGLSQMK